MQTVRFSASRTNAILFTYLKITRTNGRHHNTPYKSSPFKAKKELNRHIFLIIIKLYYDYEIHMISTLFTYLMENVIKTWCTGGNLNGCLFYLFIFFRLRIMMSHPVEFLRFFFFCRF